jgi:ribosomal protein S18 acetylase RimI-like enzyme
MDIRRITQVEQLNISDFNALLDTGVSWNEAQGNLFLQNPDNALFVAFELAQPVGFVTAYRLQRFDQKKAEVLLYEIGVHEEFRRKGIAKALISTLKAWSKEIDVRELWVLTEKDNLAARNLYHSTDGIEDGPDTTMFTFSV